MGSSVHEILQARILGWVAISFSSAIDPCSILGWWERRGRDHSSDTFLVTWISVLNPFVSLSPPTWSRPSTSLFYFNNILSLPLVSSSFTHPSATSESEKVKVKSFSRVRLFVTPWTVAHQAPPSMRFSRQEYWSGLPDWLLL